MPIARVNDCEIRYEIRGNGNKIALFIPGLGGECHEKWMEFVGAFGNYFRCISYDQRGVGLTKYDQKDFTIQDLVDDAIALIGHLGEVNVHLFGSSLGSCVARELTIQREDLVDRLILANTFPRLSRYSHEAFSMFRKFIVQGQEKESFITILPWLYSTRFLKKQGAIAAILQRIQDDHFSALGRAQQLNVLLEYDGFKLLKSIKSPCLILNGDEDLLVDQLELNEMKQSFINLETSIMDHCGHAAHIERPIEFSSSMLKFLLKK